MLRNKIESADSPQKLDVLLAAVYVPKSNLSSTSPFFSLFAYRQPATDCKRNLEAMITHSQDKKDKLEGGIAEFSAAGREYFRINMARGIGGRHQCIICSTANGHLLVWNAGASNQKGLDAIVATLNSITPLPQRSAAESGQSAGQKDGQADVGPSKLTIAYSPAKQSEGLNRGYNRPLGQKGQSRLPRRGSSRTHSGHGCAASRDQRNG